MISYQKARYILKKSKIKILNEEVLLKNSLNRVVAKNILSPSYNPSANNAAFDGFAINSNDTKNASKKNSIFFKIIGSIAAGSKPFKKKIKKNEAIEIMTGGILPKSLNTIIPIEKTIFYPNKKYPKYIKINQRIKKNNHIRFKGSDYKKGQIIIKKGTIIKSNHIMALKTLGIKKVKVKKLINILFFSTGNEISNLEIINDWEVRNSNKYYIESIKKNFLFKFKDGGILRDNHKNIFEKKIKKVLKSNINIILTTGAVSAGKFDFIPSIVRKFTSSYYFKSVRIRPGKPVLFAKLGKKVIFGLPGNPLSTAACFRFLVYPFLENILDIEKERPLKAILKNTFKKKREFTRFIKSKLNTTQNGKLQLQLLTGQESFRINPFTKSNVWAVFPSGKGIFKKGQIIDCFLPNHSNKALI